MVWLGQFKKIIGLGRWKLHMCGRCIGDHCEINMLCSLLCRQFMEFREVFKITVD